MKSNIKIIILVAVLVFVLAGAFITYNMYKENADIGTKISAQSEKTAKVSDFTFYDMNKKEVKLSDFSGKPVVINFWATWCPSCISELPFFQSAYETHKDDIQFIMLNLTDGERETQKSVEEYISENEYTFPVFMDIKGEGANTYGIYTIPQTMFIDKDSNIIYNHTGAMTLHDIETYIKQISD